MESDEVVQVYGRKIRDDVRFKHGSHPYLPGSHRGVWNREGIAAGDGAVIVCEAIIDAATFWCAGFRNVTTAYGVNGFTLRSDSPAGRPRGRSGRSSAQSFATLSPAPTLSSFPSRATPIAKIFDSFLLDRPSCSLFLSSTFRTESE